VGSSVRWKLLLADADATASIPHLAALGGDLHNASLASLRSVVTNER
jgi:hypothetical protein